MYLIEVCCLLFADWHISADYNSEVEQLYRRASTTFAPVIQERMCHIFRFI